MHIVGLLQSGWTSRELERGNRETDGVVSRVVEAVEGVVSSLFYDRWGFGLLCSSWEMS